MTTKLAVFCLLFNSLTAVASESVINGCAHEAFVAAQTVAKLNGSEEVRIASRTLIVGRETENGLLFTYHFNPKSNGAIELKTSYTVDVIKSGDVCKIKAVVLEENML